jgi:HAMP domain-containing protein
MTSAAAVSSSRARFNRWRWRWQRQMGWPGAIALALLLAALLLAAWVSPTIEVSRSELLRQQVARIEANGKFAAATTPPPTRDPRDAARDALPSLRQRGQSVAELLNLLGTSKAVAEQAEYANEEMEPGLERLRIVLPVEGSYREVRQLVVGVLNAMPNAALDSMQLERASDTDDALTGKLRLSLFFRKEAP